ncbi:isopentenyl-diphosphate delta-isomerase idi1 [Coemansia sp. BCRC 34301]|nr:isopentenyl-diphosphate delta-isomerase idi1 [Coemansia sp. BCRC 34301]
MPQQDTATASVDFTGYDEEQVRLMAEMCILVDRDDKPIGTASKKTELEEAAQMGVKRAAQRKLEHELGIKPEQVPLDQFQFLTRIHYVSPSDGQWGEHEIDYILFIKADVDLDVNPNEVKSVKYVSKQQMVDIIKTADETGTKLTPWFKLIDTNFLYKWWDHLDDLSACVDTKTIHRLL